MGIVLTALQYSYHIFTLNILLAVKITSYFISHCLIFSFQGEVNALLDGLQAPAASVREASLNALLVLEMMLPDTESDYSAFLQLSRRVWVAKYDVEEHNIKLAEK